MNLAELYIFFLPLINILGTICLIALAAASTLYVIIWILRRIWMYLVAIGVFAFLVAFGGYVLTFV